MQRRRCSAITPMGGWRRAKRVAGAVGVTIAGLVVLGTQPAFAVQDNISNPYTIGPTNGSVTNVVVTPTTVLAVTVTNYLLSFIAPSPLSSSAASTITIGDSTMGNTVTSTIPSTGTIVLMAGGGCLRTGGGLNSAGQLVIALGTNCPSIVAGATVTVSFSAINPSGSFNFSVATSSNTVPASSGTVTVSSSPPIWTAGYPTAGGQSALYSIEDVGAAAANGNSWRTLAGTADVLEVDASNSRLVWGNSGPDYSVSVVPPGGTAANDTVTSASLGATANIVCLTLTTPLVSGAVVNIKGSGTNPPSGSSSTVTVTPGNISSGGTCAGNFSSNGPGLTTSNSILFASAVVGTSLAVSPAVANATATYSVSFVAETSVVGTGNVATAYVELAEGSTGFNSMTSAGVADTTAGWSFVASTPATAAPPNGSIRIGIPSGDNISPGDAVTVTVSGVTNPGPGTYSDFMVFTSSDTLGAAAPVYTIRAATNVVVTVSPSSTGSSGTYTITGLVAAASSSSPLTSATNAITLTAPAGTVLPSTPGSYTVTDSTSPSSSGTVTMLTYNSPTSVTLFPPKAVTHWDTLTITVTRVTNPGADGNDYTMQIFGNLLAFPACSLTFANGCLVNFSGTIYVFAGGHAFGVPTPTVLAKVQAVDRAQIMNAVPGSVVPTAAPRSGTLISTYAVNGNATIYVVAGTPPELHAFSTPKQFYAFGYDPGLVVTVPNLGGMTVGSTVAALGASMASALATHADGAIVDSSGTYYAFAASRACTVPTTALLRDVTRDNKATPLRGSVTGAEINASAAAGVLFTNVGNRDVYVSSNGILFPITTSAQLKDTGYQGTPSVPVANTCGLPVAP